MTRQLGPLDESLFSVSSVCTPSQLDPFQRNMDELCTSRLCVTTKKNVLVAFSGVSCDDRRKAREGTSKLVRLVA
eukprot:757379-Hanusia_phi.AAC.2